ASIAGSAATIKPIAEPPGISARNGVTIGAMVFKAVSIVPMMLDPWLAVMALVIGSTAFSMVLIASCAASNLGPERPTGFSSVMAVDAMTPIALSPAAQIGREPEGAPEVAGCPDCVQAASAVPARSIAAWRRVMAWFMVVPVG